MSRRRPIKSRRRDMTLTRCGGRHDAVRARPVDSVSDRAAGVQPRQSTGGSPFMTSIDLPSIRREHRLDVVHGDACHDVQCIRAVPVDWRPTAAHASTSAVHRLRSYGCWQQPRHSRRVVRCGSPRIVRMYSWSCATRPRRSQNIVHLLLEVAPPRAELVRSPARRRRGGRNATVQTIHPSSRSSAGPAGLTRSRSGTFAAAACASDH